MLKSIISKPFQASIIIALAAVLTTAAPTYAQGALPQPPRLGDSAGVRGWAESRVNLIATGDATDIQRGRRDLLDWLQQPGITTTDRLNVARSALTGLGEAVADDNEQRAVNALLVIGAIADDRSIDFLTDGMRDDRAAVRTAAARGFKQMLRILSLETLQSRLDLAPRIHQVLMTVLENEPESAVALAIVQAMFATPNKPAFHRPAMALVTATVRAMSEDEFANLDAEDDSEGNSDFAADLAFRIALTIQIAMLDPSAAAQPDAQTKNDAAYIGGLGMTFVAMQAIEEGAKGLAHYTESIGVAERLLKDLQRADGANPGAELVLLEAFRALVEAGEDAELETDALRDAAADWLDAMTQDPFEFDYAELLLPVFAAG